MMDVNEDEVNVGENGKVDSLPSTCKCKMLPRDFLKRISRKGHHELLAPQFDLMSEFRLHELEAVPGQPPARTAWELSKNTILRLDTRFLDHNVPVELHLCHDKSTSRMPGFCYI